MIVCIGVFIGSGICSRIVSAIVPSIDGDTFICNISCSGWLLLIGIGSGGGRTSGVDDLSTGSSICVAVDYLLSSGASGVCGGI